MSKNTTSYQNLDEYEPISTPEQLPKLRKMLKESKQIELQKESKKQYGGTTDSDIQEEIQALIEESNQRKRLIGGKRKKSRSRSRKTSRRSSKKSSKNSLKIKPKKNYSKKKTSRKKSKNYTRNFSRLKNWDDIESESLRGGRKKNRKSSSQKRSMPPAMIKYREFVDHIAKTMKIKGGPIAVTFASLYKKKAEAQNPNLDSIGATMKAKELFDKDTPSNRQSLLKEAEKIISEKKASRKSKKTLSHSSEKTTEYSETSY